MFSRHPLFVLGLMAVAACTNVPQEVRSPAPGVVLPYRQTDDGLLIIEVAINGRGPFDFIVDSGASRSAISPWAQRALDIATDAERQVLVRGLIEQALRPQTIPVAIGVPPLSQAVTQLSVLPEDWGYPTAAGIVGMDVLKSVALRVDPRAGNVTLMAPGQLDRRTVGQWTAISLLEDPIPDVKYGLHFAEARFGGKTVLTLIDTGATFSSMNWVAATKRRSIRKQRRRLEEEWRIAGAIGTFSPAVKVRVDGFAIGKFLWDDAEFFVLDLDPLNVIGADSEPLIIAGADLLADRRYVLDFAADRLYIDPTSGAKRQRAPVIRRVPNNEGTQIVRPEDR